MDHFGDGSRFHVRIEYIEQVVQYGTGRVVALSRPFAGSAPFLLSYGDILVNPSFYPQLLALGDAEMLISVRRAADVSKGGAVYLNSAFELTDLKEKPKPGEAATPWYNAGIYTFRYARLPGRLDYLDRILGTLLGLLLAALVAVILAMVLNYAFVHNNPSAAASLPLTRWFQGSVQSSIFRPLLLDRFLPRLYQTVAPFLPDAAKPFFLPT